MLYSAVIQPPSIPCIRIQRGTVSSTDTPQIIWVLPIRRSTEPFEEGATFFLNFNARNSLGLRPSIRCVFALGVFLVAHVSFVGAQGGGAYDLVEGKNYLYIDGYAYASDIVESDEDIVSISYVDGLIGQSVGYVDVLGGVGSNFLVRPDVEYEIIVRKDVTLTLP